MVPPPNENRKRKYDDRQSQSQPPSDTASVLSNLPALPPAPSGSPPPHSQQTQQTGAGTNGLGVAAATSTGAASQQHPQGSPSTTGVATSNVVGAASTSGKSRPKRSRGKAEKKDENERQSRFHCDYCGKDLSFSVRARCAVCPDYDSCLDCFSVGAALLPHRAEHAYRLVEVVHTPIYQEGWSVDEEEKLLEGLETYGIGNWEQVAKVIGSKPSYETEKHFLTVYLESQNAPLPDPTRLLSVDAALPSEAFNDVDPKTLRVMHKHQQEDAAGWMPKREDFVYEWDNEAEDIIGDMGICDDDPVNEKSLRLRVLEIYCRKLDERERRKKFVIERNLTDVKGHQELDKKYSKEERELREKLKVFMRYVPKEDFENFINGLLSESDVRTRIEILREGRALGATSFEESERALLACGKKIARTSLGDVPSGSNMTNVGSGPTSQPSGGEPSVLSGTSQRRPRRSAGENSVSDATGGGGHGSAHGLASPVNNEGAFDPYGDPRDPYGGILPKVEMEDRPGGELLSTKEISLCETLKIVPHQYMIAKEAMIRMSLRNGQVRKKEARANIKMDHTKVSKIYDYLHGCGWIRGGSGISSGNVGGSNGNGVVAGNANPVANNTGGTGTSESRITSGVSTSDTHKA